MQRTFAHLNGSKWRNHRYSKKNRSRNGDIRLKRVTRKATTLVLTTVKFVGGNYPMLIPNSERQINNDIS